jgi:hypothetical protein
VPDSHDSLFEPDPTFAAEWFVEDALAQGAFKHACITILDQLADAIADSVAPSPDLGDFGPVGMFPSGFRPALTPLLLEKMRVAATVIGWKLAQPGTAIPPSCVGEELALELIRREAIGALELVDAPESSIDATRGVFEVCQDSDILDLFDMQEPADAAVSLTDPVNTHLGKVDMRPEEWFKPFYGGVREGTAPHPLYLEPDMPPREPEDL